jgi:hypothetical protein
MAPPTTVPLTTCAHCNTASTTLQICNNCKNASYCNRDCQKADWKWHKATCKSIIRNGDIVSVSLVSDHPFYPFQPRAFETYKEYLDQCKAQGDRIIFPSGCTTEKRRPTGVVELTVDEDKYQELQSRRAEKKAAKAAQGGDEDGEEGEEEEKKRVGRRGLVAGFCRQSNWNGPGNMKNMAMKMTKKMARKMAMKMVRELASRPDEDGCNIDHAYGIDDESCKLWPYPLGPRLRSRRLSGRAGGLHRSAVGKHVIA